METQDKYKITDITPIHLILCLGFALIGIWRGLTEGGQYGMPIIVTTSCLLLVLTIRETKRFIQRHQQQNENK